MTFSVETLSRIAELAELLTEIRHESRFRIADYAGSIFLVGPNGDPRGALVWDGYEYKWEAPE